MAKLSLTSSAKNAMATEFANFVAGEGSGINKVIGLFRTDITGTTDFNTMAEISLGGVYGTNNQTINGQQNFKALELQTSSGKVELSVMHGVSVDLDIGNYENLGPLVWAIPGTRNVDWLVIGTYSAFSSISGTLRPHAAIQLSSAIPPTSGAKTFLISDLTIEFKGDGE